MKQIPLTKGKFALVDDADYDWLKKYKWYTLIQSKTCYACTTIGGRKNKKHLRMHRLIMDAPDYMDVDHINGNGLDNRRCNLRLCTRQQNLQNACKRDNKSSRFKGVHWRVDSKRWQARIFAKGKQRSLGHYDDEGEAAIAYNVAASKYFGEYAWLNNV